MKYFVLQTTTDSEDLANAIAQEAVERRLAACVQIVPITSVYRWKGKTESAREYRCEMKTNQASLVSLREMVAELHTYDVPEILELEIAHISADYQAWLDDELIAPD